MIDTKKITRFEVIDFRQPVIKGRIVVANNVEVELQVQDDEKTLKVFLKDKREKWTRH